MVQIVAGLSLKNLQPRVWDARSPYYLKDLTAIMVSYADFQQMPRQRQAAIDQGLHDFLEAPEEVSIYLDNGAFYFATNGGEPTAREYREFIKGAEPTWRPIRFDAIPLPSMPWQTQMACFRKTMGFNRSYQHDGYVPVVHVGRYLRSYIEAIEETPALAAKNCIALGGIVPNLLRKSKAAKYADILNDLTMMRERFKNKRIHVFGIGGTATIHLAGLLGFDSVDSSGWRNRAARGIIQLPGSGERIVATLGKWRGRKPTENELAKLKNCGCPACKAFGLEGLRLSGIGGFCNRATHNLWILLKEAQWIDERLTNGTYERCYRTRLDNTTYLPLITDLLARMKEANSE